MRRVLQICFDRTNLDAVRDTVRRLGWVATDLGVLNKPIEGFIDIQMDDDIQPAVEVLGTLRLALATRNHHFSIRRERLSVSVPDGGPDEAWYEVVDPMCLRLEALEDKAYGPDGTAQDLASLDQLRETLKAHLAVGIQQHRDMMNAAIAAIEAEAL